MRQYAVISVRTDCRERLVVEYPDEKSLRDLLAAPSILALDYSSREEAEANIDCCTSRTHASRRKLKTMGAGTAIQSLQGRAISRWLSGGRSDCTRVWIILRELLQHSIAAAIVVFYSKSVLAGAVRALVSL